ncbi:peptidoglycan recognition protein family protein [Actinacidiphila yeochonensis]|uniref:peptidoglycan recognition protein family protein n=1 Tax=Actinacidiphila yeochonensis TaxID=89050 RepID=UPI00099BECA8|nr:peptidoglycan recognition protein [Actinacidiphila yeochonensis]
MRPLPRSTQVAAVLSLVFLASCSTPQHHAQVPPRVRPFLHVAQLRPAVVSRTAWHAEPRAVSGPPLYDTEVKAVFIHHTDNPNDYDCRRDVPAMLRGIEESHVALGWDDLGYNFVVDRCGTIYEGRAGGVDAAVRGAHTEGFNVESVGIAALGNFGPGQKVPRPMLESIAAIAAWKLAPGVDPNGEVRLVSTDSRSRFAKGTAAELHAISGHRDAYQTDCPGDALYDQLPWIRRTAAALRRKATYAPRPQPRSTSEAVPRSSRWAPLG